jgi:hypothetical protein
MSRLPFDEVCHECLQRPNDSRRHAWCPECHAEQVARMNANCNTPETAEGQKLRAAYAYLWWHGPWPRRRPTRRRVRFVTGSRPDLRAVEPEGGAER